MSLAQSASDTSVNASTETDIATWTADGVKEFVGFVATGEYPAEYRLYFDTTLKYKFQTSAEQPTAFVADKAVVPANNVVVDLRVYHTAPAAKNYFGTILGA